MAVLCSLVVLINELLAGLNSFLSVCQSKVKGAFCRLLWGWANKQCSREVPCRLQATAIKSRAVTQSTVCFVLLRANHCLNTPLSLSFLVSLSLFPSRGLLTSDSPSQIIPMQSNRVLLYLSSQGRHSTAKTCFVPFNLFHWGRKPTVTLSFASDAVGLPRGPNVRLHHAVLVILPKYSSSDISGCRRKFTVSHTWPLVGHCLRPWEVVKIELIVNSYQFPGSLWNSKRQKYLTWPLCVLNYRHKFLPGSNVKINFASPARFHQQTNMLWMISLKCLSPSGDYWHLAWLVRFSPFPSFNPQTLYSWPLPHIIVYTKRILDHLSANYNFVSAVEKVWWQ